MNKNYKIYYLYSTRDLIPRYIGFTKHILTKRLSEHIKDRHKYKNHKDKWIAKEIKDGFKVQSELIEDGINNYEEITKKEISYIKLFKSFGANLVNSTIGGEGAKGIKCSEELKRWNIETKSKRIYSFCAITGKLVKSYSGFKEMIRVEKFTESSVRYILMGKKRHYKGLVFSYDNSFPGVRETKYKAWNKGRSTIGLQQHKNKDIFLLKDNIVLEFESIKDCINYLGISKTAFYKYSKGKKIQGFKIEY